MKSQRAATGARGFCEKSYFAQGDGARVFVAPPQREVPGRSVTTKAKGAWTWVNLWATWCVPCVEEMALLGRWKTSLARDGVTVEFELISIDDDEDAFKKALTREYPGHVGWLRGQADLAPLLESLGVDKSSPIPVHALVDPQGRLRCVRVGAVHDADYGMVKTLLLGG